MSNPEAHVSTMSIFDSPRIRIVRDSQLGCISLYFGRMCFNVYGNDPYDVAPELVEQTEKEARQESTQIGMEQLAAFRRALKENAP